MKLPTLVENWRALATRATSVLLWYASIVLGVLDFASGYVSLLEGVLPPRTYAVVSLVCAVAGVLARFVHQPALHAPKEETHV